MDLDELNIQQRLSWIAVDWGSTHVRAYALDQQNVLLAQTSSAQGMSSLQPQDYEGALLGLVQPWLGERKKIRVLACGMVGAKQGWCEAPYRAVPCYPADGSGLQAVVCQDQRLEVHLVAGLCQASPADVMRGEETQLLGLLGHIEESTVSVCLPGTHSKWVFLQSQQVQNFRTYMTGEFYALLSRQSMLRHSMDETHWCEPAFGQAVLEASEQPQDLLNASFGIRARSLLQGESAGASAARLSGWLIGCELASAADYWREKNQVELVGADRLCQLYARALEVLGAQTRVFNPDQLTLAGLQLVHHQTHAERTSWLID